MNEVRIDGLLTRDPESKIGPTFTLCKFSIAHKDQRGSTTSFFEIETWGDIATECQKLKKGSYVSVDGYMKQDIWVAPDNQKRSKIKIIAKKVATQKEDSQQDFIPKNVVLSRLPF